MEGDPDLPSRLKAVESAVAAFSQTGGLSSVDRRLHGPPRRPRMRSAEYGMRRDAISGDAFGMCVDMCRQPPRGRVPTRRVWGRSG